jgi:hypothetical protein
LDVATYDKYASDQVSNLGQAARNTVNFVDTLGKAAAQAAARLTLIALPNAPMGNVQTVHDPVGISGWKGVELGF